MTEITENFRCSRPRSTIRRRPARHTIRHRRGEIVFQTDKPGGAQIGEIGMVKLNQMVRASGQPATIATTISMG